MKQPPAKIAVVSTNRDKYSETFIQQAYDALPGEKVMLYGGYLPTHSTRDWREAGIALSDGAGDQYSTPAARLKAWLSDFGPDVILVNYGPSGVAMAQLCSELRIPMVLHYHGYDAYRADVLEAYGQAYAKAWDVAAAIVVVSQDMERQLLQLGAPAHKLHLNVYGADLSIFQAAAFPSEPVRFLFVGRFVAKKAPDLLIRAFAAVQQQLPAARLVMVGDGEELAACQSLAQDLGLGSAIDWRGVLSQAAVADCLAECHALVLPSRRSPAGDSEGTPLVILEAGAMARPVIATQHAGIPEVIQSELNGLCIPSNDLAALIEAMLRLANDLHLAEKWGLAGRKRIQDRYSNAHYQARLWDILENAWQNKRNI